MKNLTQILTVLMASIILTACGGAASTSASTPATNTPATNTPAPSTSTPPATNPEPADDAGELIIDNGRGTSNNQDTERPED